MFWFVDYVVKNDIHKTWREDLKNGKLGDKMPKIPEFKMPAMPKLKMPKRENLPKLPKMNGLPALPWYGGAILTLA